MDSVKSWRGLAGDEELGEMKADQEEKEQDEDGRKVGKMEEWGRCFVEGLETNGFEEDILG